MNSQSGSDVAPTRVVVRVVGVDVVHEHALVVVAGGECVQGREGIRAVEGARELVAANARFVVRDQYHLPSQADRLRSPGATAGATQTKAAAFDSVSRVGVASCHEIETWPLPSTNTDDTTPESVPIQRRVVVEMQSSPGEMRERPGPHGRCLQPCPRVWPASGDDAHLVLSDPALPPLRFRL